MATLSILEFGNLAGAMNGGNAQAALGPPVAKQTIAIGSTSTASATFNSQTRLLRIATDTNCYIAMSTAPTATSTGAWPMFAGTVEYFGTKAGQKLAVIST